MDIIPTAILASMRGLPIRTIAVILQSASYVLVGQSNFRSSSELKGYLKVPDDEAEKSYDFLIKEMPQDLTPEDAVVRAGMDFAQSALKLAPDAVPDISKVRDWSYAEAAR